MQTLELAVHRVIIIILLLLLVDSPRSRVTLYLQLFTSQYWLLMYEYSLLSSAGGILHFVQQHDPGVDIDLCELL